MEREQFNATRAKFGRAAAAETTVAPRRPKRPVDDEAASDDSPSRKSQRTKAPDTFVEKPASFRSQQGGTSEADKAAQIENNLDKWAHAHGNKRPTKEQLANSDRARRVTELQRLADDVQESLTNGEVRPEDTHSKDGRMSSSPSGPRARRARHG